MKHFLTSEELVTRQSLPLEVKVEMTKRRIEDFINEFGIDNVYVSFSGGKDSTVLLDIARQVNKDIKAVFLDTWLEYPELRQFVKQYDNVDIIKPQKSMKEIITEYGWCFPSKDAAQMIEAYRRNVPWAVRKINGLDKNGNYSAFRQQYKKWLPLAESDINISHKCCIEMKEKPVHTYEKTTKRKPIIAIMADESARRKESYLRTGCNSFDGNRPLSKPMGFWTEQDVLQYIAEHNLKIAPPYGDVIREENVKCKNCKYRTTGESRTGCIFCPVGGHLDNFSKMERLKKYNPKLYDYCMEELGEKKLVEFVRKHYVKNKVQTTK